MKLGTNLFCILSIILTTLCCQKATVNLSIYSSVIEDNDLASTYYLLRGAERIDSMQYEDQSLFIQPIAVKMGWVFNQWGWSCENKELIDAYNLELNKFSEFGNAEVHMLNKIISLEKFSKGDERSIALCWKILKQNDWVSNFDDEWEVLINDWYNKHVFNYDCSVEHMYNLDSCEKDYYLSIYDALLTSKEKYLLMTFVNSSPGTYIRLPIVCAKLSSSKNEKIELSHCNNWSYTYR